MSFHPGAWEGGVRWTATGSLLCRALSNADWILDAVPPQREEKPAVPAASPMTARKRTAWKRLFGMVALPLT